MKHLVTIALIVISLIIGYAAGVNTASKDIADVTASDAGVQITYTDGTGYWYEY